MSTELQIKSGMLYLNIHVPFLIEFKEPRDLSFFKEAFIDSHTTMMSNLPSRKLICLLNYFDKIQLILIENSYSSSSSWFKDMDYDEDKDIDQYFSESCTLHGVGSTPEHIQYIAGNLHAQRRQYGFKHHATSTIHFSMGDTLHKVAMEILDVNNRYKLWGKKQVVLALSRTKEGKITIFVGDKRGTINSLVSRIKTRTQWTNYMDEVLSLISINGKKNCGSISTHNYPTYPFLIADIPFP